MSTNMKTPSHSPKRTRSSSPIRRELSLNDLYSNVIKMDSVNVKKSIERLSPLKKSLTYSPSTNSLRSKDSTSLSPLRDNRYKQNSRVLFGTHSLNITRSSSSINKLNSDSLNFSSGLSNTTSNNNLINDSFMFFEETGVERSRTLKEYESINAMNDINDKENSIQTTKYDETNTKDSSKNLRAPFTVIIDYESFSPTKSFDFD